MAVRADDGVHRRTRRRRRRGGSTTGVGRHRLREELGVGVLERALRRVGALPDATITVVATTEGVLVGSGGETAEIVPEAADHIFVRKL